MTMQSDNNAHSPAKTRAELSLMTAVLVIVMALAWAYVGTLAHQLPYAAPWPPALRHPCSEGHTENPVLHPP